MLDWPEFTIIGVTLVLMIGAIAAISLGIWRLILWFEWTYCDHTVWMEQILTFLHQRHLVGAHLDHIAYETGLRLETAQRLITEEMVRLVDVTPDGRYFITDYGVIALGIMHSEGSATC